MKFPADKRVQYGTVGDNGGVLKKAWDDAAIQASIKYGAFVEVKITWRETDMGWDEIYFEIAGHKFGSLDELERALKNKAFL